MKVVIVGGVAGGASAAARIRRLDEHAQIIMIERSGYVSYANCGLPYYVGGVIKEQEGQCGRANGAGDAFSGIQHPDAGRIQGWKGHCQIGGLSV